ncbi:MAG TPA: SUMF1/EgtB/PvdO family nonheme iron enzyme [Polyangiaceae bacterium]
MGGRCHLLAVLLAAPALCHCEEPSLPLAAADLVLRTPRPAAPSALDQARRPEPVSTEGRESDAVLAVGEATVPAFPERASCADGMVLVEGEYCPEVEQRCQRYLTPYGRFAKYRCAEYGEPRCLAKRRRPMRFCIDRDEYTEAGARLPLNHKSFVEAEQICQSAGKRICTESEWNFACEGTEMRPYPYGFERDSRACNADRTDILTPSKALRDLRAPSDAFPECLSPFGVRNLTGNLEEFVLREGSDPPRPAMKGAYWQPSQNSCRARQTVHGAHYSGIETGFRCCSAAASPK